MISQTAEYAFRAITCIAQSDAPVRATDLADRARIPNAYVSKILRKLVVGGLLLSRKGHHGGFVLARPANEIRYLDVLEAVDQGPDADRCFFGWERCNSLSPCPLHGSFEPLKRQYQEWAASTTVGDAADCSAALDRDP